jgi:hypothetical protein
MTQPSPGALQRAAAVADLVQGEVVSLPDACVTLADAGNPLSAEAIRVVAELGVSEGVIWVPQDGVDDVVLLSQTCDLQETTLAEFHCLVAPVRKVSKARAYEAWRGQRPGEAGLPWLDEESIVDLSRITTIERSLLVDAPRRGRPQSLIESLHFAQSVERYLTRPALPDHVNAVLVPFVKRFKEKHDKDSPEGRCAHLVSELRLEGVPDIEAADPALNVLMVLEERHLPLLPSGAVLDDDRIDDLIDQGVGAAATAVERATNSVQKREAWMALSECWAKPSIELAAATPGIGSVEIEVLNGEELSYARSKNAPILDYRYLTTRAA